MTTETNEALEALATALRQVGYAMASQDPETGRLLINATRDLEKALQQEPLEVGEVVE